MRKHQAKNNLKKVCRSLEGQRKDTGVRWPLWNDCWICDYYLRNIMQVTVMLSIPDDDDGVLYAENCYKTEINDDTSRSGIANNQGTNAGNIEKVGLPNDLKATFLSPKKCKKNIVNCTAPANTCVLHRNCKNTMFKITLMDDSNFVRHTCGSRCARLHNEDYTGKGKYGKGRKTYCFLPDGDFKTVYESPKVTCKIEGTNICDDYYTAKPKNVDCQEGIDDEEDDTDNYYNEMSHYNADTSFDAMLDEEEIKVNHEDKEIDQSDNVLHSTDKKNINTCKIMLKKSKSVLELRNEVEANIASLNENINEFSEVVYGDSGSTSSGRERTGEFIKELLKFSY